MHVLEYVNHFQLPEGGLSFVERLPVLWNKMYPLVRSETRVEPLLASIFWQIAMVSPFFDLLLFRAGTLPGASTRSQALIVPHGPNSNRLDYDLLILDPAYRGSPITVKMEMNDRELFEGWTSWVDRGMQAWRIQRGKIRNIQDENESNRTIQYIQSIDPTFAVKAQEIKPFRVILDEMPRMLLNYTPSPRWGASDSPKASCPTCTVGTIAVDKVTKKLGVTLPLHAIPQPINPGVTKIFVNEAMGKPERTIIKVSDALTDAVFVELNGLTKSDLSCYGGLINTIGGRGPMRGIPPRNLEEVYFEGVASGLQNSFVKAYSPHIPFNIPGMQSLVYTDPITNPSDSGAAIINREDYVLGFALSRTPIGARLEFSSWVWADAVYEALDIEIP